MKKYYYFIFYNYFLDNGSYGMANGEIPLDFEIKDISVIHGIEKAIEEREGFKCVKINNFILSRVEELANVKEVNETSNVGKSLKGHCDCYFGRDSYKDKMIEKEGYDWIVVRYVDGNTGFASFSSNKEKEEKIKEWVNEED